MIRQRTDSAPGDTPRDTAMLGVWQSRKIGFCYLVAFTGNTKCCLLPNLPTECKELLLWAISER